MYCFETAEMYMDVGCTWMNCFEIAEMPRFKQSDVLLSPFLLCRPFEGTGLGLRGPEFQLNHYPPIRIQIQNALNSANACTIAGARALCRVKNAQRQSSAVQNPERRPAGNACDGKKLRRFGSASYNAREARKVPGHSGRGSPEIPTCTSSYTLTAWKQFTRV